MSKQYLDIYECGGYRFRDTNPNQIWPPILFEDIEIRQPIGICPGCCGRDEQWVHNEMVNLSIDYFKETIKELKKRGNK